MLFVSGLGANQKRWTFADCAASSISWSRDAYRLRSAGEPGGVHEGKTVLALSMQLHANALQQTLYTGSFLYTGCITCIKLSILSLYKRLFPVKPMINAVHLVGFLVILWCFGVCLVGALTCIPVKKLWDPTVPGGCIDLPKFYYGLQVPNIVTDFIILVMPMKLVWDLPISRVQKMLLSGIFVLGFVYVFISEQSRTVICLTLSTEP